MKRIIHTALMVLFALPLLAGEPEHFSLPFSGNGTNHMNFYFMEATVGGEGLQAGDEIAVFDGEVCTGAVQLDGTLPSSPPFLLIAASRAEPGVTPPNGYTEGNTVSVKMWDASTQTEYQADLVFYNTQNEEIDPVSFAEGTAAYLKISAPVPVTIGLAAEDKEYDGDAAASVDYVVTEGTFSGDVTVHVTNGAFNDKHVGLDKPVTADMEVTGKDVVHYDFTLNASTTASISAKPVTITGAEAEDKTYDGTASATITGAQLSGGINGDEVTLSNAGQGTFAQANVGTGIEVSTSMQLTGSDAGNYSLTGQPSGLTADITKALLTVTADDQEKAYDGEPFSGFTASFNGLADGESPDDLEGTLAYATTPEGPTVEPGTWEIIPSGLSSDNYEITFEKGALEIKKATLTVTADNKTKVYGAPNPELTFGYSGFVPGEDASVLNTPPAIVTQAQLNSNAGLYTITLSGGSDDNYTFHYEAGWLHITKATAEVLLSDLNQPYSGEPVTVAVETQPEGLTVEVAYDGASGAPVEIGEYMVIATVNDNNYKGSAEGTLRILDSTAPQIDPSGLSDLAIVCGANYQEQLQQWLEENAGATASDDTGIEGWSYDFDPEVLSEICGLKDTSITITFTAEDGQGNEATVTSILHVKINEGPFLVNPLPDQVINASYELFIPLSNISGEIFDDVNDPVLSLQAMVEGTDTLPHWAGFLNDTLVCSPMIADTGCVNIVVEAADPAGATATDTFRVCVDGYPTGLDQAAANQLKVNMYPNPTRDKVTVELNGPAPQSGIELSVFDITGRQVLRKKFAANRQISFDMTGNAPGTYLVRIENGKIPVMRKLIVDKTH